jgi:protein-S-isoprenylcysteine O-methyltransferase Ste14
MGAIVLWRSLQMKKLGIKTIQLGIKHKREFLIPPLLFLFFYFLITSVFKPPKDTFTFFNNSIIAWLGVAIYLFGFFFFLYALFSFKNSFRIGIDEDLPGKLVTTGAFALSRNPMYTAFLTILFGTIWVFPTWIFLLLFLIGFWLIYFQIRYEEASLKKIYGQEYLAYCQKTRRFF